MIAISEKRALRLLNNAHRKRIIILGDIMLDQYLWGCVERISPEAPVPVVEIQSESLRLGGAANVAHNIWSLGSTPLLVGLVGTDHYGQRCLEMFQSHSISTQSLVPDPSRPTTVKTRIMAHHQQVLRTDMESKHPSSRGIENKIIDHLRHLVPEADAVLIQDYNKGTLTKRVIREATTLVRKWKRILTVDPKFDHFFDFTGATVLKPNQTELEVALGTKIRDEDHLCKAGKTVLRRLKCASVLITRGQYGMTLIERDGTTTHVPARAKQVFDVSGAGDTAISVLTVALAAGASLLESATLANYAAGIVCGQVGVVPVTQEGLVGAIREFNTRGA